MGVKIYNVKTIKREEELLKCSSFQIEQYQWNSKKMPKTYGYMGYMEGRGLVVSMISEEENPKCVYIKDGDMVCEDSAMEVFLAFPEEGEEIQNECMYLNFEINPNAALYAKYGKGRAGRQFFSEEYKKEISCKTVKSQKRWEVNLCIPDKILQEICHVDLRKKETIFYCNFYKISEDKEIEHYGSYSPIQSETPNFHLPIYFAKAILTE